MACLNKKHLRALLNKNWIYWKRQYIISAAEIICPILLMLILLVARNSITPSTITEQDFYQTAVVDKLNLTPEQWAVVGPLIAQELQFPKVNYMVYPFFYAKGYEAQDLIDYEDTNYQYLSYQARARDQLNPGPCINMDPVRQYIGLFPQDNYTEFIEEQLGLWSFQYSTETGYFVDFKVLYFNSEEQMMDYVAHPDYEKDDFRPGLCAGVSHYARADGNGHEFRIHLTDQNLDDRQTIPSQSDPAVDRYNTEDFVQEYVNYNKNFYSYFHNWMANAVLRNLTGIQNANIINLVMQMKIGSSEVDQFDYVVEYLMPIAIVLLYIIPIHRMVMRIVSEKQTKLREVLRMMGLSDINYWLSWFIFYSIIVTVIAIFSTIIICAKVFIYSNWWLIFFFFWGLGMSLFGYVVFIQSLFTNPRLASIMSILIYFFTYFADYAVNSNYTDEYRKIIASILPSIAMARALSNISKFEKAQVGLTFNNVNEVYQNYQVVSCYYMYATGFILSLTVGIYFTNVLPTTPEGIRRKLTYPFKKSYWCPTKKVRRENQILNEQSAIYIRRGEKEARKNLDDSQHQSLRMPENENNELPVHDEGVYVTNSPNKNGGSHIESQRSPKQRESLINDELELRGLNPQNYEPVDSQFATEQENQNKILRIQNLQKTYSNGFQAVKGLNVKMYNGQIFALLGHNGAGKTTTISMLTGLIGVTAGICEVFGYDLKEDIQEIRQLMGVCPQHDILFDLLTPEEHLDIFCDFKGVSSKQKAVQIKKMIYDIGLSEHSDKMAMTLSGGNKRKLSVALALIGDSKLVLLDEPTAGMDLTARRKLWNMLKDYKHDRIIILTTHYMDEADILGDRIGIMTSGKLTCLGSSLFLKNRFGIGYQLQINRAHSDDKEEISDYLSQRLGDVKLLTEIQKEMTFQIPFGESNKIRDFFDQFDQDLMKLGIKSYGVSVTTLEEVFLRIGSVDLFNSSQSDKIQKSQSFLENQKIFDDYSIADDPEKGGCKIFSSHFKALFRKRLLVYKRNFKSLVVEIFVPIILVLLGLLFSKIQFFLDSPPRYLTTSLVPHKQRLVVNQNLVKSSGNDFTPQQIIQGLPDYNTTFDVQYIDYSYINLTTTDLEKPLIVQYDSDVYNASQNSSYDPIRYGSYFIYQADKQKMQFKILTEVNLLSQDVAAFYPHFMYQSIIRLASGKPNYQFDITTRSFPVTASQKLKSAQVSGIFLVIVVAIAFSLIPAVIISFILNEKEKNIKHLQLISGMSLPAYWFSNMIFDIVKSMIPCGVIVGLIYAFQVEFDNIWIMFPLYPIGAIPFTYVTSFFFQSESVAQTTTIFLHFLVGGIGSILVSILRIISSTYDAGDRLMWVFKIIPTYCLTEPISYQTMKNKMFDVRPDLIMSDLSFQAIGGDIYFMIGHGILWTIVLVMIECRVFTCISRLFDRIMSAKLKNRGFNIQDDEDVKEEESRVASTEPQNMKVRVDSFRKVYTKLLRKSFLAVEQTSFGLDYGECFALLGVNGAGKTTIFKSLTGEVLPTNGQITINGMNITNEFNKIRKLVGYCPQHDALFEAMTVEEHLYFYAKIKGIRKDLVHDIVDKQIRMMNLNDYKHKLAGNLSGGNKRKLSVAICVIGNPPIILLDEPSAGMDPEARRFMWSVVAKISQERKKSAVILTTHSMEEAEALSTKMGIMVQGGIFRCFGSSQHIKNKFGTGYEIEVKIQKLSNDELNQKIELYGLGGRDKVKYEELPDLMRRKMLDEFLIEELDHGALGDSLFKESLENDSEISCINFINWIQIELNGSQLIKALCDRFGEVDVLEHYNDYYKLRVPKGNHTIGRVFSLIESQKEQFCITSYSASQTTLEQIFQKFANQVIEDKSKIIRYRQRGQKTIRLKDHDIGADIEKPQGPDLNNNDHNFDLSKLVPDV